VKILTEAQIRQVVRQELKNYLFEQEENILESPSSNKVRILGSILAATILATMPGHEGGGIGGASADDGGGGGATPVEILKQKGLKKEYLREFNNNFSEDEIQKLASLGQREKQIDKLLEIEDNEQEITKLKQEKARLFSSDNVSPELLEKIETSGSAILTYVLDMDEEQVENLQGLDTDELEQLIQTKAFSHAVNPKNISSRMSRELSSDASRLYSAFADQGYLLNVSTDPETNLEATIAVKYGDQLGDDFTLLDAVKVASKDDKLKYQSNFLNNPYYEPKLVDQFASKLNVVSKDEIKGKAMGVSKEELAQTKGNVQESKINKLRQRLNELRGVYV
jgi:hypothetical protein